MAESSSLCVMSSMSRRYGRVVHLRQLSTPCCHDAVAFGYRRVNVPPDRDFHPAGCALSQAHERRLPAGLAQPDIGVMLLQRISESRGSSRVVVVGGVKPARGRRSDNVKRPGSTALRQLPRIRAGRERGRFASDQAPAAERPAGKRRCLWESEAERQSRHSSARGSMPARMPPPRGW